MSEEYLRFSWVGGYTLIYLTPQNDILCASCAMKHDEEDPSNETVQHPYWEGDDLYCDNSCDSPPMEASYKD
jgi:hypothetical protein